MGSDSSSDRPMQSLAICKISLKEVDINLECMFSKTGKKKG